MPHVFLSAGHGGSDPGACAYGMREKDINLDIMLQCKSVLEAHGVKVTPSRVRDEEDSVQQEVREANACGADLAVSFHANAGKGNGSESFYWPGNENGKRLAQLCEKHTQAIGQNSRGVKTNNLMFTRATTMTAVLCECAFIDNDADNDIIDTLAERQAFGTAYAKAILEYYGIPYNDGNQPAPSQPSGLDLGDTDWTGPKMMREWQCQVKAPVIDGMISYQNDYNANTVQWAITVSPPGQYRKQGSLFVKKLQALLEAKGFTVGKSGIDGHMGKDTVKALQRFLNKALGLNLEIDGLYGHATSSAVGIALQRGLFKS